MTSGSKKIVLIGAPADAGGAQRGPAMGPAALRRAGLRQTLLRLGCALEDHGDLERVPVSGLKAPNARVKHLDEAAGWTRRLLPLAVRLLGDNALPVWLGGDHSLSLGTVPGAAAYAKSVNRPLYVLWLDAHPDFNTFETTQTGNLHGVPAAYFCGLPGFDSLRGRRLDAHVEPANLCMMGIRSVDEFEQELLNEHGVRVHSMRAVREHGVAALLRPFLREARSANGMLHVSFDVDFLDPCVAPGAGTTVSHGANIAEAREAVELVHESGLMTSLDLVELNPFLDDRGRTARLMVDLTASLFGRQATEGFAQSGWSGGTIWQAGS